MSTAPLATPHTPSLRRSTEGYGERAWRKLKEEPLVPLGTLLTVGAFTMAVIKLRQRESQSLNRWMRVRVAAQAFTVAAVCAYYWNTGKEYGGTQPRAVEELQAKRDEHIDKERREFEGRLQAAEAQWKKESQGSDHNTVLAKGDVVTPVSDSSRVDPQARSTASSSWWKMVWLWGRSSSPPQHQNEGGNAKDDRDKKPL